jgi:Tol biopolymer transport system component/DNA-binding winged helix-turn-helix (wHTH) protein
MSTGTEKAQIYTFGPYRLDPSERLLSRDGTPVALTPKAFDLLVYLVERHGRLVEKSALMRALWPNTVVEEANVAYNIAALRKALGNGREDAKFIETVPTRGYRFVAQVVEAPSAADHPDVRGRRSPFVVAHTGRTRRAAALAATMVLVCAAAAWLLLRSPSRPATPPLRLVPLTTLTGQEGEPSFSPDGEQVAFAWNGAKQDNWDIYVTMIGSSEVRRLTSDPATETQPAWSHDGRHIAYLRERPTGTTIQLVSAPGGVDRKVIDFLDADSIDWARDDHWLVVGRPGEESPPGRSRGIYLIPVDGGDARPLLASPSGVADFQPAVSPDGRQLAYVSCSHAPAAGVLAWTRCAILLVDVDRAGVISAPRRLTSELPFIASVSWARDGSAVIYAGEDQSGVQTLWRVGADGTHRPERIELAGIGAWSPATALSRDRLAFTRTSGDTDIYRFEVGHPAELLVGSSFEETEPRLSQDGRRLVFASKRSGDSLDIWMANADGSAVQLLTGARSGYAGSPYWSPDGRQIVFDSFGDDYHWHIWAIDAEGGTPRRLTTQTGDENTPTWSRDGRYIYFSADPGSGRDIWRVSASGGIPERVTHGASGYFACESADGKGLLFQARDDDSPLMMLVLANGDARQLLACVRNSAFGVGPEGVYYVPCDPTSDATVHVVDLKTRGTRRLGTLDGLMERPLGLTVSPDGNTIVYPRKGQSTADLMLIENFR